MSSGAAAESAGRFRYQAFGLVFQTSLALPELRVEATAGAADVTIAEGPVPAEISGVTSRGVRFQAAPGEFLLRVDNVAKYHVTGGNRIVIAREPGADDDSVRAFLLAQTFGALLHQRDDLVLHGSAIGVGHGGVAFLGSSGVGKSTTAAAFRRRGYPVLTDDLCVVREAADGRLLIHPGFPQMKLWLDSLERLDVPPEGLRRLRHKIEKRVLPLREEFASAPLPVRKIFVLQPGDRDALDLTPVEGPRKFRVLKTQTYRFGFLAGIEEKTGHFQLALKLAQQAPLAIVTRPETPFRLEELVSLIEADLRP